MFRKINFQEKYLALPLGILLALFFGWANPFSLDAKANTAVAIALLMVLWWVTEALPMPVVALLPVILHPLFHLGTIEETTKAYSNPVIFLFMGGFLIGIAIEKWNLHKRIALQIVSFTGTSGNKIILGFMIATAFLSMWLSNTATTMMMFPIALSVIRVMKEHPSETGNTHNFALALMLTLAYASNIGGMATMIGTPPNIAYASFFEKKYGFTISFSDWMALCIPISFLLLLALYIVLTGWLYPNRLYENNNIQTYIQQELKSLGPLSIAEKRILVIFVSTALLWIFKDLWNQLGIFKLDDTIIAMTGALTLFATPAEGQTNTKKQMLLKWSDTSVMSWGILLLFGGGIAMANSLERTGIMTMIGHAFADAASIKGVILIFLIATLSIFMSELMSNVAQVIVLAPVLAAVADASGHNSLQLGLAMTLAASAASMLPMGTPPNAIVFSSNHIPLKEMLKTGLIMNLISIVVITLLCRYLFPLIFQQPFH